MRVFLSEAHMRNWRKNSTMSKFSRLHGGNTDYHIVMTQVRDYPF